MVLDFAQRTPECSDKLNCVQELDAHPSVFWGSFASFDPFATFLDVLEPHRSYGSGAFGILKKYSKTKKCEQLFDAYEKQK